MSNVVVLETGETGTIVGRAGSCIRVALHSGGTVLVSPDRLRAKGASYVFAVWLCWVAILGPLGFLLGYLIGGYL